MADRSNAKLELRFKDRVGIVADLSARIAKNGMNIASMEVARNAGVTHVYVEIEDTGRLPGETAFFDIFGDTADLEQIRVIDTLPHEERENRFRVVLDNVSDGVVSVDTAGRVTTINRVARRMLARHRESIIGLSVKELNLPDDTIQECLKGREVDHVKQDLITDEGRFQYFATGRPIRDSKNRVIGAVEIAKDMQEIRKLARSLTELPGRVRFGDIVGITPPIREAIAFAQKIAPTDAVVSIRGESGTGKELFARAIHTASGRKGPLIPVNCAALPEQLLESELFGYVGGAFTGGMRKGKPGLFEIARNGTLFLDEIADLSQSSQAKILRAIQEKAVRRVGGSEEIPIDVRILTATNKNLKKLVEKDAFRQDLYYRINVLPILIPALRDRRDDVPLLVEHFLLWLATRLDKSLQKTSPEAMRKLMGHDWPGNVRELKNVVERAAILNDRETIHADCIVFSHDLENGNGALAGTYPAAAARSLKEQIAAYERDIVRGALHEHKTIRKTARALGISHPALLKKLKKLGLHPVSQTTIGS